MEISDNIKDTKKNPNFLNIHLCEKSSTFPLLVF